jgi:hypothetical protein
MKLSQAEDEPLFFDAKVIFGQFPSGLTHSY